MGEALHTSSRVDIRPWPHEPSIAHLVLRDVHMVPTAADVDAWVARILDDTCTDDTCTDHTNTHETCAGEPITAIRTGALFPAAAEAFLARDFVPIDRLTLLERPIGATEHLPRPAPVTRLRRQPSNPDGDDRSHRPFHPPFHRPSRRPFQHRFHLRRLRTRDLDLAATIDVDAFDDGWRNDARSLDEIRRATPVAHTRLLFDGREAVGFALTGKAGATGYLQRFAVRDGWQGRGGGRILVDDALRWLSRRGASTALVNTGTDNDRARRLYESCGFTQRPEQLVVLERRR